MCVIKEVLKEHTSLEEVKCGGCPKRSRRYFLGMIELFKFSKVDKLTGLGDQTTIKNGFARDFQ